MRTKSVLYELGEIAILYRYLYLSPENKITFSNGITELQLRMDDELNVHCKNLSFPEVPEANYEQNLSPYNCLCIIEALKHRDAEDWNLYSNRWEEILYYVRTNFAFNMTPPSNFIQ